MTAASPTDISLPTGFASRSVDPDADSPAVTALCETVARATDGFSDATLQMVRESYNSPGFDPETDARLVFDAAGTLVGVSEFYDGSGLHVAPFVFVRVLPGALDAGIGEALLGWAADRGQLTVSLADPTLRVALHTNTSGANEKMRETLERAGWRQERMSWEMEIEVTRAPAVPALPPPVQLRAARRDEDEKAVYEAEEEIFADHFGFVPRSFDSWMQFNTGLVPYDPTLWFLAMDGNQIAGISLCLLDQPGRTDSGYVWSLGVRRPWRGRGVGLSLLRHSFAELYRRGRRRIALHVDSESLTGATRLYERAGMHVVRDARMYELVLREGREVRPV
jgi:mycothiol synthase